jgi:hypothetical protein
MLPSAYQKMLLMRKKDDVDAAAAKTDDDVSNSSTPNAGVTTTDQITTASVCTDDVAPATPATDGERPPTPPSPDFAIIDSPVRTPTEYVTPPPDISLDTQLRAIITEYGVQHVKWKLTMLMVHEAEKAAELERFHWWKSTFSRLSTWTDELVKTVEELEPGVVPKLNKDLADNLDAACVLLANLDFKN